MYAAGVSQQQPAAVQIEITTAGAAGQISTITSSRAAATTSAGQQDQSRSIGVNRRSAAAEQQ
jgi:hypothetical protein